MNKTELRDRLNQIQDQSRAEILDAVSAYIGKAVRVLKRRYEPTGRAAAAWKRILDVYSTEPVSRKALVTDLELWVMPPPTPGKRDLRRQQASRYLDTFISHGLLEEVGMNLRVRQEGE